MWLLCFTLATVRRRWHDVGRRIDAVPSPAQVLKRAIERSRIEFRPRDRAEMLFQCLPCFDSVEYLEQNGSKEDFAWLLGTVSPSLDF